MKLARYAKFDCFPFQKYMFCGLEMGFSYVLQYKICSLHLLESSRHSRMRSKNHGTHFSGSRTSGYISILCRGLPYKVWLHHHPAEQHVGVFFRKTTLACSFNTSRVLSLFQHIFSVLQRISDVLLSLGGVLFQFGVLLQHT